MHTRSLFAIFLLSPALAFSTSMNTINKTLKLQNGRMITVPFEKATMTSSIDSFLAQRNQSSQQSLSNSVLPSRVNLTMNGVPKLDQGSYPSCTTFALTGLIDAASIDAKQNDTSFRKGYSQQCFLELVHYLTRLSSF